MVSDEKDRRELLKEEYFFLQGQYEDFDRRSLSIKGWISGGAAAALALGVNGTGDSPRYVAIIIIAITASVWWLEVTWKLFQGALRDRIRLIEAYFRSDEDIFDKRPSPLQIYHAWFRSFRHDDAIYPYEMQPDQGNKDPRRSWLKRLQDRLETRPRSNVWRVARVAFQPFVMLPYAVIILIAAIILSGVVATARSGPAHQVREVSEVVDL
jgi:hypothetical protein